MDLAKKLMDFIVPGEENLMNYTHRTRTEELARNILQEGFEFSDSFQKTTDAVVADPVHIQYWHKLRECYGVFTIVISIDRQLFESYLSELKKIPKHQTDVVQTITEKEPHLNENNEPVYTLPRQFIKGYFNSKTGKIVYNPDYNPSYDSPKFKLNIEKLKKQ